MARGILRTWIQNNLRIGEVLIRLQAMEKVGGFVAHISLGQSRVLLKLELVSRGTLCTK